MSTFKLTLIFAALAFALALAVTASEANAAAMQTEFPWCGSGQNGAHAPHGYGSNCQGRKQQALAQM